MKPVLIASLLFAAILSACSPAKPLEAQQKLKLSASVRSWEELAPIVASQTKDLAMPEMGAEKSIFILPGEQSTPFSRAFSEILATELVKEGVGVSESRSNALFIKFNAQIISPEEVLINVTLQDGFKYILRESLLLDVGERGTGFFAPGSSMKIQDR